MQNEKQIEDSNDIIVLPDSLINAALAYARRGWKVLPLVPKKKTPLTEHGKDDASDDPDQIKTWWTRWPKANIGGKTGEESGIMVLDVDGPEGFKFLEDKPTLETLVSKTGKGRQIFYQHPGFEVKNFVRKIPDTDFRGDGGYVVLPPSIHPNGQHYAWLTIFEPAPAPKWLLELIHEKNFDKAPTIEGKIPIGQRNNVLTSLAGSMRRRGFCFEAINAAIQTENQKNSIVPLPESEVENIAKSICKYDPKDPPQPHTQADPDRYFTDDKKPKFKYEVMVADILDAFHIITFTDTERLWTYSPVAGHYLKNGQTELRKYISEKLGAAHRKHYADETIYQVKTKTYADRQNIEPPARLLNIRNGILNIKTLELISHTPQHFFTSRLPVEYKPEANGDVFQKFIKEIVDIKGAETLQEYAGYTLQRDSRYKKALFLHGDTDTAKSTYLNLIKALVGTDNVAAVSLQRLEMRFQKSRLYHKLANIYPDLSKTALTRTGVFKYTTGNDPIEAEIKNSMNFIKFTNYAKHYFSANDLPEVTGDESDAFYNRLLMVEFTHQFKNPEKDPNILEKLTKPEELSTMLNWALEGLHKLNKQEHFTHDQTTDYWREHYKRAASPVYAFAQDRCDTDPNAYTVKQDSYDAFIRYCLKYKLGTVSKTRFYEGLPRHCPGIRTDREKIAGRGTPQVWRYLKIIETEEEKHGQQRFNQ